MATGVSCNGVPIQVVQVQAEHASLSITDTTGTRKFETYTLHETDRDRLLYLLNRAVQLNTGEAPEALQQLMEPPSVKGLES